MYDQSTGAYRYLTGQITLNAALLGDMLRIGRDGRVRATVMHELGHVLGLAHVDSPNEVMARDGGGGTQYGAGDLEGLARLGDVACGR